LDGPFKRLWPIQYSLSLIVGIGENGVRLALIPPFTPFHPPLFIPWKEMTFIGQRRWLLSTYQEFTVGRTRVRLQLAGRAGRLARERIEKN
jgi:hypothetical protein